MEHDARSVANELIHRSHQAGRPITNHQTVKLAYLCHAWMLAIHRRPLLSQPVEAWQYGPIIPEIYRSLRRYGGEPVRRPVDLASAGITEHPYDPRETSIIDQVSEKYGHLTGVQLSAMTNAPGTPWEQIRSKHGRTAVIPDPVIEDYYARIAERSKTSAAGQRNQSTAPESRQGTADPITDRSIEP